MKILITKEAEGLTAYVKFCGRQFKLVHRTGGFFLYWFRRGWEYIANPQEGIEAMTERELRMAILRTEDRLCRGSN